VTAVRKSEILKADPGADPPQRPGRGSFVVVHPRAAAEETISAAGMNASGTSRHRFAHNVRVGKPKLKTAHRSLGELHPTAEVVRISARHQISSVLRRDSFRSSTEEFSCLRPFNRKYHLHTRQDKLRGRNHSAEPSIYVKAVRLRAGSLFRVLYFLGRSCLGRDFTPNWRPGSKHGFSQQ